MKKWKLNMRRTLSIVLALCLSVAVAGCGKSADTAAGKTPGGAAASADATKSETPVYGGTFVYADVDPKMFYAPETTIATSKIAMAPALETLGRYNSKGITEPFLAKSIAEDPKAKTLTITLPSGVKFHDGSELNAEVVKFNLELYQKAGKGTSQLCSPGA